MNDMWAGSPDDRGGGLSLCALALLFAVTIATFLPQALARTAWKRDEVRIAEVSRQMHEYGHPLVPHLNGRIYSEKPPLLNWMIQWVRGLVGDWFVAGHIVTLAFVALGALSVAGIASGTGLLPRAGPAVLSGLVFITTQFVARRAVQFAFDPILTGFVLAGIWCWLTYARSSGRRKALAWAGAALAIAGASLTKGPVALLHGAVGMIAVHTAIRRFGWRDAGALLGIMVVGAVAPLLWVLAAAMDVGWWFWDHMTVKQTTSRLAGEKAPHARPVYDYLFTLPIALLPLVVLIPGAVRLGRASEPSAQQRKALRALIVWFVPLFVIFSLISGKRMGYLLPLAAPAAMLVVFGAVHAALPGVDARGRRMITVPLRVLGALIAAFGVALLAAAAAPPDWIAPTAAKAVHAPTSVWSPALRIGLGVLGLALVPVGWMAGRSARTGATLRATALVVAAFCLTHTIGGWSATHALEPFYSPQRFVQEAMSHVPDGEPVYLFPNEFQGRVSLFSGREHFPVLARRGLEGHTDVPCWVIAEDKAWGRLPEAARAGARTVHADVVQGRSMLLLRVDPQR